MPGYRLTPHTADIGLLAWGTTLGEAFGMAARALVAVSFDPRELRGGETRRIDLEGADPERQLVRFLGEIVYLIDAERFIPARAEVALAPTGLSGTLDGRRWETGRPARRGPQVKAVTYHGLRVDPGPPARVRVVLDV